jgi:hypothetical protein
MTPSRDGLDLVVVPTVTSNNTTPARRCPDFDSECVDVRDHLACWKGGIYVHAGERYQLKPAMGYCPFLMGMKP